VIPTQMKLIPLIYAAWLAASCPSWAVEQKDRFLEFRTGHGTLTYDLSTVQMIQPGRFTIISTTIDDPDVMKLKLKALDTLRTYCTRPDGQYAAPADLLALGPPDMPVKSIEVQSNQTKLAGKIYQTKTVHWFYPYKRLALNTQAGLEELPFLPLHCKGPSETKDYLDARSLITNGSRAKYLFDCNRGMMGLLLREDDDPAKAFTYFVKGGGFVPDYLSLCHNVTHEWPYLPE
jgi:hypothetical protein